MNLQTQFSTPPLLVVGSVNADTFIEIDRLPRRGETIQAKHDSGFMVPGGKGANQAVVTSRLEAHTYFIGMFGNDGHGKALWDFMADENINLSCSSRLKDKPSGQAFIFLEPDGENSIIIIGGANQSWPEELSPRMHELISESSMILLQREIPDRINILVASAAREFRIPVIMDAGGADMPFPKELLKLITVFSPNETELARITHLPTSTDEQIVEAAKVLQTLGPKSILVKLGSRGSLLVTPLGDVIRQDAVDAENVVDTTGAGDCFTAAFATATLEGLSQKDSMFFGSAASSICIQTKGCTSSFPQRQQVMELIEE